MDSKPMEWPFPNSGLNTEVAGAHKPPAFLDDVENMYLAGPNQLRSRGGFSVLHTASGPVTCLYYWPHDDTLYHAHGTSLYAGDTLIATADGTITDMVGFGAGAEPDLIVAEEKGDRDHTLHTWDGSSYEQLTGEAVPCATRLLVRASRLYAFGDEDNPSTIYFSSPSKATQWLGAFGEGGAIPVAPGSHGPIVDWQDRDGILIIFKRGCMYQLAGDHPAAFQLRPVGRVGGVIGGTSADCVRGILYGTQNGVYPVGQVQMSESDDLTRYVQSDLQGILRGFSSSAVGTRIPRRAGYSRDLNAYVLVDGTETAWVSNIAVRPDVWTRFTLPSAADVVCGNAGGFFYGDSAGNVYQYDHDTVKDGATAFDVSFRTVDWDVGLNLKQKTAYKMEGAFNGGENSTVTLELFTDAESTPVHTETLTPGDINRFKFNINFRQIGWKATYTNLTGPARFGGSVIYLHGLGDAI
jgi:hypothetical protein